MEGEKWHGAKKSFVTRKFFAKSDFFQRRQSKQKVKNKRNDLSTVRQAWTATDWNRRI